MTPSKAASEPADVLPRVVAGEPGAVEVCLDRYGGLVWSLAQKFFPRRDDAEDAVQEAFVSLWKNADRYSPDVASEATFVAMVARRRMIDLVRRVKAARRSGETESTTTVAELAGADAPPSRGAEVAEEVARVRHVMQELSQEQQRVLRLALCEGHSQTQIAEATGWPIGTVKSHARRGMQRLRKLLDAESSSPNTEEATS